MSHYQYTKTNIMKNILIIITLFVALFSCKKENTTTTQTVKEEIKVVNTNPIIVFEKTACFGTCPIYIAQIYEDGRMTFKGNRFVKLLGEHTLSMPLEDINSFQRMAKDINFFDLEESYDGNVTDLPSTITTITLKDKTKTVTARFETPANLNDLNKALHDKIMSIADKNAESILYRAKQRDELRRTPVQIKEVQQQKIEK